MLLANIYVGQRLTQWRPGRDLDDTYSAQSVLGGGVLRDLSHELDYALWLFGLPVKLASLVANHEALGIQAEESATILYQTLSGANVCVHLNYLDHQVRRDVAVQTAEHTYDLNLLSGQLLKDGVCIESARPDAYQKQLAGLQAKDFSQFCSYAESLTIMNFIEEIERNNMAGPKT